MALIPPHLEGCYNNSLENEAEDPVIVWALEDMKGKVLSEFNNDAFWMKQGPRIQLMHCSHNHNYGYYISRDVLYCDAVDV